MKENKYDDQSFFEQYGQMSRSVEGLPGAGEWYALRGMLPDVRGKRVLDLGCGYGWHCGYAVEQGAEYVLGVDLSSKMIARARELNSDPRIEYRVGALEDFRYSGQPFDLVLSSLTFHYLAEVGDIFARVREVLSPGGEFIFSVEHPVFTAQGPQQWHLDSSGDAAHWPVDRYFEQGSRQATFLGESVLKYHRTLTTYIKEILGCGFRIVDLLEPEPEPQALIAHPELRDELRRPMMLIIRCAG